MIEITKYDPSMQREWDQLVDLSRNGTFLHRRGYMDYHSDRFVDASLMAHDNGRLVAVLPANRADDTLWSHQGLTHGGWIVPARHMDGTVMMRVMEAAMEHLRANGVRRLIYKAVPHIYHRYPAEEDIYALWRCGARLSESNLSSVIDLNCPLSPDRGNKAGMNRALRAGVATGYSDDWQGYWNLLESTLQERYGAQPVHTLAEMKLLRDRFPDNILLYTATLPQQLLAGVVVFLTHTVARCQYIAASEQGREVSALALLMDRLRTDATARGLRWLDFGTSNGDHGQYLHESLLQQKARLGGRGIAFNTYQLDL
ncbi:MAG: GNAT family N-acetyltransferase [Muribaculaceae bacterium]|nr:GNAT family N-acetyltransferase [Muribaculaceae bacterium]